MKFLIIVVVLIFSTLPAILMAIGAIRLRKKRNMKFGGAFLLGSCLLFGHLVLENGSLIIYNLGGDAQDLADYTLKAAGIQKIMQYSGLILIAIGFFMFKVDGQGYTELHSKN